MSRLHKLPQPLILNNSISKININTTRPELSEINMETGNLSSQIKSSLLCLGKLLPQPIINKQSSTSDGNLSSEINIETGNNSSKFNISQTTT